MLHHKASTHGYGCRVSAKCYVNVMLLCSVLEHLEVRSWKLHLGNSDLRHWLEHRVRNWDGRHKGGVEKGIEDVTSWSVIPNGLMILSLLFQCHTLFWFRHHGPILCVCVCEDWKFILVSLPMCNRTNMCVCVCVCVSKKKSVFWLVWAQMEVLSRVYTCELSPTLTCVCTPPHNSSICIWDRDRKSERFTLA